MKKIILTIFVCMVLIFPLVLAADEVSVNAKVVEAQAALNVPGFDASSIFATSFTDEINPSTGALTISLTDAILPGRNGHNVVISRRYSSNIFLNINEVGGQTCGGPAAGVSGINNIACSNCDTTGLIIDRVSTTTCSSTNGEQTSFIRAKYLGRGWTMNYLENRFKDVTPLIYNGATDKMTYEFVPVRGTTSQSVVVDNQERSLIFPSMFEKYVGGNDNTESNYFFWGVNLANIETYPDNYWVGGIFCNQNNPTEHPSFVCRQSYAADETENPLTHTYNYVSYTDDLSPVFISNQLLTDKIPSGVQQQATYYSKDGKKYVYNHNVPFCSKYDEIPTFQNQYNANGFGYCDTTNTNFKSIMNWAQNPYAGTYLNTITDNFGNQITINYLKTPTGSLSGSPFINTITAPGGRTATFYYDDYCGGPGGCNNLDINSKLYSIAFPAYKGSPMIYINYKYDNVKPLLLESYLSTSEGGNVIPGTKYTYTYDPVSQELIEVGLPTGATVKYTYGWSPNIPVVDSVRGDISSISDLSKPQRRVVVSKEIINGGECLSADGRCVWSYTYNNLMTTDSSNPYGFITTVIDPNGYRTEYKGYPTTAPTLTHQQ
jgi:hypothetical protein